MKPSVLAICGSIRAHSSNHLLLESIRKLFEHEISIDFFQIERLPHFNPEIDNEHDVPAEVIEFRKSISDADGFLVCTPEFVFSLSGARVKVSTDAMIIHNETKEEVMKLMKAFIAAMKNSSKGIKN